MSVRRKFRFIKEIARGGFGTVYLSEMTTGDDFSTVVAVKILHTQWSQHREVVMRSRDEARLLGRLRHRHIVRVEDLTMLGGHCAVVMEYLEGVDMGSLLTWLGAKRETLPPRMAFQVIGAVATALEAAFSHVPLQGGEPLRLIHRDIKPSNIMVTTEGEVKLLDFGTARANFETREAHTEALHFGSQIYMAPERFMGDPDTRSGDIFALGITLYELLVGEPPGRVQLRIERFEAGLEEALEKLQLPGADEEFVARLKGVLRGMMAFHEKDRMTASEVEDAMEDLAEQVEGHNLRRFAREHVRLALTEMEELEPAGDTLAGTTIEEDRTATFDTEGLELGAGDLAGQLSPGSGGSETSAGWLDETLLDEIAAAKDAEDSDRTLEVGEVDEEPTWTSETVPGEQPAVEVSQDSTVPVMPPPGPEETTAPSPTITGTIDFEQGSLGSAEVTAPSSSKGRVWGAVALVAIAAMVAMFMGGGEEESEVVAIEAPAKVSTEEAVPEEPVEEPPAEEEESEVSVARVSGPSTKPVSVVAAAPAPKASTPVASISEEAEPAPEPTPEPAPPPKKQAATPGTLFLNTMPVGGADLKVTHSSGFLRICRAPCIRLEIADLPAGTYTTKVTPKGMDETLILSVRVRGNQTCKYNLKKSGDAVAWEERGCE